MERLSFRSVGRIAVRRIIPQTSWVCLFSLSLFLSLLLTKPSSGVDSPSDLPAVKIARPTWDTGWFQTEVLKLLLEELEYTVAEPVTRNTPDFYGAAARGEIDLWASGWFPSGNIYLERPEVEGKVEAVGFVVDGKALQGYMIDKSSADRLGVSNLGDLKDPAVARTFDHDGNGKADLIGCNQDWSCADIIQHQLKVYGLTETVEPIQADYSPLMGNAIERYEQGQPILFYNWTPNWTLGKLAPGEDVVWLETPFSSLPDERANLENQTTIANVTGCVNNPCNLGFPKNDIRAVANTVFLDDNPAVRKLLTLFTIPLEDIEAQNALMMAGESEESDILRHAQKWIQDHRAKVDLWLKLARDAAIDQATGEQIEKPGNTAGNPFLPSESEDRPALKVVVRRFEPFVTYEDRKYGGFSIELWDAIATEMEVNYQLYGVNSAAKLFDDMEREVADVAIGGAIITSEREQAIDFSYPYFSAGMQIMVLTTSAASTPNPLTTILAIFSSPQLYYGIGIFILILMAAAHIIWLVEHRHNPDFPRPYLQGVWEAFWWAVVTATTVGYGDKTPKRLLGRLVGLIWMCVGYFVFAYFTASIATTFTLQGLQGSINGLEDLFGRRVATVASSAAATYLQSKQISAIEYDTKEEAFLALQAEEVEAIVYDAPVLNHYASGEGKGYVKVVGSGFKKVWYAIAVPPNSPYRDQINLALVQLIESGAYYQLHQKWFGAEPFVD